MNGGVVWSEAEDRLLALGLLRHGRQGTATIASRLLPAFTLEQVSQRLKNCCHKSRTDNPVKVCPRLQHPATSSCSLWLP